MANYGDPVIVISGVVVLGVIVVALLLFHYWSDKQ